MAQPHISLSNHFSQRDNFRWISSKGKTIFSLNFLFFTPEFEWNLETEGEIKYLDEGKICSYAKYYI